MKLQPLNDYILLRPVEVKEETVGGIYVPESARDEVPEGIVEALPPDPPEEIAIGDRVIFKKYAGEEITIDGEEFRLVPSGDLLCKYVEADSIPE